MEMTWAWARAWEAAALATVAEEKAAVASMIVAEEKAAVLAWVEEWVAGMKRHPLALLRIDRFGNNRIVLPLSSQIFHLTFSPRRRKNQFYQQSVEAPLALLPGEDEEAARARIEKKRLEEEEAKLAAEKAAEEAAAAKAAEESARAEAAKKAGEAEGDLLAAFASGDKLGADLKAWCEEQGSVLPSVEKLVFHLLMETQKDEPNPECTWADASNQGTALAAMVEDNVSAMTEVLFAIQRFCVEIKFPRVGGEYLVQAMFRNMYKFDLADEDAFEQWRDDESAAREGGKGTSIIQTMDWFNWLDEDDEESEEEYEEEEE
eukprot:181779_1